MTTSSPAQPESRKALHELLDTIRRIDEEYLSEQRRISNSRDVVEGEHYLMHLVRAGMSLYLDNDPELPHFAQVILPTRKFGGDGTDHLVFIAPIEGASDYMIRGKRTGEVYISFTAHTTDGEGGWATGVVSDLNHTQVEFEPDGSYEIHVSCEPTPGTWLRSSPEASIIVSRHYYQNETPACSDPDIHPIVSIHPVGALRPQLPYAEAQLARKFRAVGRYILGHTLDRPLQTPETTPRGSASFRTSFRSPRSGSTKRAADSEPWTTPTPPVPSCWVPSRRW